MCVCVYIRDEDGDEDQKNFGINVRKEKVKRVRDKCEKGKGKEGGRRLLVSVMSRATGFPRLWKMDGICGIDILKRNY